MVLIGTNALKKQATLIRDTAQKVIDACDNWPQPIEASAQNRILGGSLAKDATVLAIMIMQAETTFEEEKEEQDDA